ncbi:hypothetical protein MICRO11B_260013 [Micrococcus luteus]|nr:hypothetical protein MICRO11B_260013 [Micrococcus luteus]
MPRAPPGVRGVPDRPLVPVLRRGGDRPRAGARPARLRAQARPGGAARAPARGADAPRAARARPRTGGLTARLVHPLSPR